MGNSRLGRETPTYVWIVGLSISGAIVVVVTLLFLYHGYKRWKIKRRIEIQKRLKLEMLEEEQVQAEEDVTDVTDKDINTNPEQTMKNQILQNQKHLGSKRIVAPKSPLITISEDPELQTPKSKKGYRLPSPPPITRAAILTAQSNSPTRGTRHDDRPLQIITERTVSIGSTVDTIHLPT